MCWCVYVLRCNQSLSFADRVANLVANLTFSEKMQLFANTVRDADPLPGTLGVSTRGSGGSVVAVRHCGYAACQRCACPPSLCFAICMRDRVVRKYGVVPCDRPVSFVSPEHSVRSLPI